MEGSNHSGGADNPPASSQQSHQPPTDLSDGGNTATARDSSSIPTPSASTTQHRQPAPRSASSATAPPTTTAMPPPTLRKQLSGTFSNQGSSNASPSGPSRNASPVRKDGSRVPPLAQPLATQPSAAAIQRALSAASVPTLQSSTTSDASSRVSRRGAQSSGETTPQSAASPRLKSPPPGGSAANPRRSSGSTAAPKKTEGNGAAAPSISVQPANPTTIANQSPAKPQGSEDASKNLQVQTVPPVKGPSRGPSGVSTLETVQENSADDIREPSPAALQAAADLRPLTKTSDEPQQPKNGLKREAESQHVESGSESAGKADKKQDRTSAALQNHPQRPKSISKMSSAKTRQGEGKQGMTVETETVPSIPQSAINTGDRSSKSNDGTGSVRLKTSNETIRPKKERKKASQKPRSVNQSSSTFSFRRSPFLTQQEGFEPPRPRVDSPTRDSQSSTACEEESAHSSSRQSYFPAKRRLSYPELFHRSLSQSFRFLSNSSRSNKRLRKASSKADIFEARVASAVDEANSSESDETFVYESNPPDPQRRSTTRHHSRTPSVASQHSVADHLRPFADAHDERRIAGKRSMKFSNNLYNDLDSPESKDGSVRSSHHQPRHFGRFGRGGSHASIFDPEINYQACKLRPSSNFNSQRRSRPESPRSGQQPPLRPSPLTGRKQESSYDMDVEGADDERTPLIANLRSSSGNPRGSTRTVRRNNNGGAGAGGPPDFNGSSIGAEIDPYYHVRRHSRCGRYSACLLGFCIVALVILSAVGFLITSGRPLYDVQIHEIRNILASEQELFLDLCVRAVNPNSLGIGIADVELDVFAKSKFVGSNKFWREHGFPDPEGVDTLSSPPLQPLSLSSTDVHLTGSSDHGTDPPSDDDDDLERDAQVMLLGRIHHFDQALSFDGTPLSRRLAFSLGSLRLDKPGNKTETGGSARWEKVLKHDFDLIVRGTLRYGLPISGRGVSASVQGVVRVDADGEHGGGDGHGHEGDEGTGRGKKGLEGSLRGDDGGGDDEGDDDGWLRVEFQA